MFEHQAKRIARPSGIPDTRYNHKACRGYASDDETSQQDKNRLTKPIFERSTSMPGIKRACACKRSQWR